MNARLIAAYPRSGSTWLRFILCNLYFPNTEHDFASVNKLIPAIDNWEGLDNAVDDPPFFKTHELRNGTNVIFLHRHVGDVLISEWWYKRKFHNDGRPFLEFCAEDDWGRNWRLAADHYFPAREMIGYDELDNRESIQKLCPQFTLEQIAKAIDRSSFNKLQAVERKGFGSYPTGDPSIKFFREGRSQQWKDLGEETRIMILYRNRVQLKAMGYMRKS